MTQQIISTGITPNDHGGDTLRVAGEKINSNFTELYTTSLSSNTLINGVHTVKLNNDGFLEIDTGVGFIAPFFGSGVALMSDASGTINGIPSYYSILSTFSSNNNSFGYIGTFSNDSNNVIATVATYDDATQTTYNWDFGDDASLQLPLGGKINFGLGNATIQAGMGFHISSEEGIDVAAIDMSDPENPVYRNWYFDTDGILTSPGDILDIKGNVRDIPQNLQDNGEYTLQLSDSGKHIYKTDSTAIKVPTNEIVSFPIGTTTVLVSGANTLFINATDNMTTSVYGAGFGISSSWYIPPYSIASLLKIENDAWMLSGAGLAID